MADELDVLLGKVENATLREVDCIYIDPPSNTGAKDWKYDNDYVDLSLFPTGITWRTRRQSSTAWPITPRTSAPISCGSSR